MTERRTRAERRTAARHASKSGGSEQSLRSDSAGSTPGWIGRYGTLIALAVVLVGVALIRLRVAGVPLERDEGEYAYAGQLILRGIPPYQLAYNMKFPGTYYAYSVILALFGQTPWGIHVGLLFVNAATTVMVFLLGRKLIGEFGATVGASAFAVLSIDRWIMGVFAHATHFVLLPAIAGLFVLTRAMESKRRLGLVGAGVLLGTAVLMKQQAVFFLPLGFGLLLWSERRARSPEAIRGLVGRAALLVAGGALPFVLLCVLFAAQGVFGKFWFWTFQYASEYVSQVSLKDAGEYFIDGWRGITRANLPIWVLSMVGVVTLWVVRWSADVRVFLTGLLVASFLALCPGFYFRGHYFILLLPAAGLFVGVAVASTARVLERLMSRASARAVGAAVFIALATLYVSDERIYLFSLPTRDLSRATYGTNPFIEAVDIANYIRERTTPEDRIAILGSEPEIYFYANRKSATGYIYTYPLMERQKYASRMQGEMIQEIEAAHPAYMVFITTGMSWLVRSSSDQTILTWADRYLNQCYDRVGAADIYSATQTAMVWDAAVAGFAPQSKDLVYTFRRKSDAPCVVPR